MSKESELQINGKHPVEILLETLNEKVAALRSAVDGRVNEYRNFVVPLGATANTEAKWQLPLGCKSFVMHSRNGNIVRIATSPGLVAGSNDPYFTLKAATNFCDDHANIKDHNRYFYFACSVANEVVEIIVGV